MRTKRRRHRPTRISSQTVKMVHRRKMRNTRRRYARGGVTLKSLIHSFKSTSTPKSTPKSFARHGSSFSRKCISQAEIDRFNKRAASVKRDTAQQIEDLRKALHKFQKDNAITYCQK